MACTPDTPMIARKTKSRFGGFYYSIRFGGNGAQNEWAQMRWGRGEWSVRGCTEEEGKFFRARVYDVRKRPLGEVLPVLKAALIAWESDVIPMAA